MKEAEEERRRFLDEQALRVERDEATEKCERLTAEVEQLRAQLDPESERHYKPTPEGVSPRPWKVAMHSCVVNGGEGYDIAGCCSEVSPEDAEHIVSVVNNWDALLAERDAAMGFADGFADTCAALYVADIAEALAEVERLRADLEFAENWIPEDDYDDYEDGKKTRAHAILSKEDE